MSCEKHHDLGGFVWIEPHPSTPGPLPSCPWCQLEALGVERETAPVTPEIAQAREDLGW